MNYIKTGLILMLYMLIAGFLVSFVYISVKPSIDKAEFNAKLSAIEKVLMDKEDKSLIENIPDNSDKLNKFIWKKSEEEQELLLAKDAKNNKVYSPIYKFNSNESEIYVLTISGVGFGGDVKSVISIVKENDDYYLNKIEVIDYSQETPGLGAKISEEKVKERFYYIPKEGLNKKILVDKDSGKGFDANKIDQYKKDGVITTSDLMTGATITPRAITNAIDFAVQYLKKEGVM